MPEHADDQDLLSRLRRRIGSVGAAAAALIAQYSVVEASNPVHRLLHPTTVASIEADKRSTGRPVIAPLVLKSSDRAAIISVSGHRSHSSHSSHRSHVSGSSSSHSSHYSSSVGVGRATPYVAPRRSSTNTRPRPATSTTKSSPSKSNASNAEKTVTRPDPTPVIDYSDPMQRLTVHNLTETSGVPRATIMDLKEGTRKRVGEGDVFAGYQVVDISAAERRVTVMGADKIAIVLSEAKD